MEPMQGERCVALLCCAVLLREYFVSASMTNALMSSLLTMPRCPSRLKWNAEHRGYHGRCFLPPLSPSVPPSLPTILLLRALLVSSAIAVLPFRRRLGPAGRGAQGPPLPPMFDT